MPRIVYVSRERRPSLPHKFKGGALNTLVCTFEFDFYFLYVNFCVTYSINLTHHKLWLQLRVSGLISNGPYVLAVDCDMYCNDPSSAKQAMCFFLDPETSKYIAFVQFPQMFHNLSKKDIYDNQSRTAFKVNQQNINSALHLFFQLFFIFIFYVWSSK